MSNNASVAATTIELPFEPIGFSNRPIESQTAFVSMHSNSSTEEESKQQRLNDGAVMKRRQAVRVKPNPQTRDICLLKEGGRVDVLWCAMRRFFFILPASGLFFLCVCVAVRRPPRSATHSSGSQEASFLAGRHGLAKYLSVRPIRRRQKRSLSRSNIRSFPCHRLLLGRARTGVWCNLVFTGFFSPRRR